MAYKLLSEVSEEGGFYSVGANELDDVDCSGAGVEILPAVTGKSWSIREVLLSPSNPMTVKIVDGAAATVLPTLNWDTPGGAFVRKFLPGQLIGGVGQSLKVVSSNPQGVSTVLSAYLL